MIWLVVVMFVAAMAGVILAVLRISAQLNQQLNAVSQQVNERLKETSCVLQDTHRTVGERLDSASRVFGDIQKSLGRLEETHKHILDISKDISSLQELLRAPKFRGELGESLLGKLLEEILPKENIRIQHRFKSGDIVDAAVVIGGHLIPVDAKFSLENFKKMAESSSDEEKQVLYKAFIRDVKKRVDEVSSKYILPDEGTFDFAMMYIPSEAVYYQISRDEELCSYAKSRKVILVSPNTFYAYLQALLYGLRGVNIQKNIQKIFADLGRMEIDFRKFQGDFELVGRHLTDASSKYQDARMKMEKFSDRLISTTHAPQIEEKEA
ncbi:MAG: DNA recombination protein RmuC [Candidatus Omnitrophota bacterium]